MPEIVPRAMNDPTTDSLPTELKQLKRYGGYALLIYVAILCIYSWLAWCLSSDEKGGRFGDAFGALNTAFSGLGFVGLALAIYLQYRQLKAQMNQLELQSAELILTRQQLARSAQAQEESEKALRLQLKVMALNSRITAITPLIKDEESHLREAHGFGRVDSMTIGSLEHQLTEVKGRLEAGKAIPTDHCLYTNLMELIDLRKEVKDIHNQLRVIATM